MFTRNGKHGSNRASDVANSVANGVANLIPDRGLLIAPNWMGDAVMSHALIRRLHSLEPQRQLDVLASESLAPLYQRMPEVQRVLPHGFTSGWPNLRLRYRLARSLRGIYSHSWVLPNSYKSALIPWFARIPRRIGWRGERRYGLLNELHHPDWQRYPMMVQRYAALAGEDTEILPPQLCAHEVGELRHRLGIAGDEPILVLAPGAAYGPAKRWPEEHFATLARHFSERGWQVWVLGSHAEELLARRLGEGITGERTRGRGHGGGDTGEGATGRGGVQNLAGKTDVGDAIDLLACAQLAVCNDSGLAHFAAALDVPLVCLYGPSSPQHTPPLGKRVQVAELQLDCRPCGQRECPLGHHDCMRKLMPEAVIDMAEALL